MKSAMHLSVKTRATAALVLRSASLNWVFWKSAIFWPNALRSAVYCSVQSMTVSVTVAERIGLREPLLGQLGHHLRKALALLAQQIACGNPNIVEEQFRGILRLHAELFQVPAPLEAGPVALDNEQGHALGTGLAVRLGREYDEVTELPVGNEHLLAVDDEIVAVARGPRPDRLQVAAGMRFRHPERTNGLAGDHSGQPCSLLRLGAEGRGDRLRPGRYG